MKTKILIALLLLLTFGAVALVYFSPPSEAQTIRFIIREADGSPVYQFPRGITFPNGSLSTENGLVSVGFSPALSTVSGAEATNAILTLAADESDDNGDDWTINSVASGNALTFANDASGSQVTKLSLSTTGVLTLVSDDVLTNATDDVLSFESNDEASTIQALGFEAKDAKLVLDADQGDDNGDTWTIESDHTTNGLLFLNHTTQVFSLSSAGVLTLADSETITNASDVVTIAGDDGAGALTLLGFEASAATLLLSADQSDDNGDDWQITNNTSNQLLFNNDASGSQVLAFGMTAPAGNLTVNGSLNYATDSVGSDSYAITLSPAPTAYTTGMLIVFKAGAANTGACTVNVNGLGAKALYSLNDGATPPDNYIETGSIVVAVYDGTQFQMIQPDANP
jgi:hypothetical protein